jgi:surface protein
MFNDAEAFNQDLSSWDTSNVEDFSGMFNLATAFNGDLSTWDTSSATTMEGMFFGATSFNRDISDWDTSNVTTLWSTFEGASSFDQDISGWDISNVETVSLMFEDAGLSTPNYDALLIGWESQDVHDYMIFDAGDSQYSSGEAAEARLRLIKEHVWTIDDGGQVN